MSLFEVKNITVAFGGVKALNDVSFDVDKGEIFTIIGPNGDFSTLPDSSKWILTFGMILGRLELFAILVLFLPSFWRN